MRPMLATPGTLPASADWAYELKWDGIRLVTAAESGRLALASRNGVDHTGRWPRLAALAAQLPAGRTVLDGELVAFDDAGRPSFGRLMSSRGGALAAATLCLFDVVVLDGVDLSAQPWQQRRALLESLQLSGSHWRTPEAFDDGAALLSVTASDGLEGVVAKRRQSPYRPGVRSPDWVKVAHRRTTSVVVGGWQRGGADGLRSLVVGLPAPPGALQPLGSVGSGLSATESSALLAVLPDLATTECPFDPAPDLAGALWVEPVLVVDVEHLGHTDGLLLRQPVFVRARPDLTPDELLDPTGGDR